MPAVKSRLLTLATVLASLATGQRSWAAGTAPQVTVIDDGERVPRDQPLAKSPWPGDVDLFALRGETIAFQVVVDAGDEPLADLRAELAQPVLGGVPLEAQVSIFVERFIDVRRASFNESESEPDAESLAFTARAAPSRRSLGFVADPLVPSDVHGPLGVAPHQRAALWVDVDVPTSAPTGRYRTGLRVLSGGRLVASRTVRLRVLPRVLPYAAAKTMVYYEPASLARRFGSKEAGAEVEPRLRALFHAHHLSAIRDVTMAKLGDGRALDFDADALEGAAYVPSRGYHGPGAGVGEGVFAVGAYGSLGAPSDAAAYDAERLLFVMRMRNALTAADAFLYAVDEQCESPWAGAWRTLASRRAALKGLRVGVTCGKDPEAQDANLVMQTPEDYSPARARLAREARGAWVWAYNGRRPFAGPLMLDVPATDLRANAWIAARYGVPRWFYWESTYWFDDGRGGRGGALGFDPFVVADTFHNADGDHANGDGILVYPGTQPSPMISFGTLTVFPSVRLKNLRRGIEDAGYIALAREVSRARADAIVRRMVPVALDEAPQNARPAWPERGASWLDARAELARLVLSKATSDEGAGEASRAPVGCHAAPSLSASSAGGPRALALQGAAVAVALALARRRAVTPRRR